MGNPIDDLARQLNHLQDQIRKLAVAERANLTDVRGGFTRWKLATGEDPHVGIGASDNDSDVGVFIFDDEHNDVGYFGTTSAGTAGRLAMGNPDNSADNLNVDAGKIYAPLIPCAWQLDPLGANWYNTTGYAEVTGGTYARCWTSLLPITSGAVASSIIAAITDTAVIDVRIRIGEFGAASPVTLMEQTGITGAVWLSGSPWTVPTSMSGGNSPIGKLALLEIEARVASGSGSALIAPDMPAVNRIGA